MRVNEMEDEDLDKWKSYWHWVYHAVNSYISSKRFGNLIESILAILFLLMVAGSVLLPIASVFILWGVIVDGFPVSLRIRVILASAVVVPLATTYIYYRLSRKDAL